MSFFVSDSLKGRVTENELVDDKKSYIETETEDFGLFANIRVGDSATYEFEFLRINKKNNVFEIVIEIPQTFKYLNHLFESTSSIEIKNNVATLFTFESAISNFTLEKQNERSCYLLKIVIDV